VGGRDDGGLEVVVEEVDLGGRWAFLHRGGNTGRVALGLGVELGDAVLDGGPGDFFGGGG